MPERILIVDDDLEILHALKRTLYREFRVETSSDPQTAFAMIQASGNDPFAVVVSDYLMPGMNGIRFCEQLRQTGSESVRVMLTGHADLKVAIEAVNQGNIFRFLMKPVSSELLQQTLMEACEQYHQQEQLRRSSIVDGLTRLYNHVFILSRLEEEIESAERYAHPICVLMLDIDHFKRVNDTYGHRIGDTVLQAVAGSMLEQFRSTDIIGRYGGEEFLVILPHTMLDAALASAERFRLALAEMEQAAPELKVTISGGLTQFRGESLSGLIDKADRLLYLAKEHGRNQIVCDSEETRYV